MSPVPPSKRRRLDSANHTLSQPFKSPFKTPLKPKSSQQLQTESHEITSLKVSTPTVSTPSPSIATTISKTPTRRPYPPSTPIPPPSSELKSLQNQHTALLSSLSSHRADLETHTQALEIESSTKDAELQTLISTWRVASRAAADEVYGGVRDRVNRMGGMRGWREREREKNSGFGGGWGWEGEGKGEKRGEGDDEGERENEEKVDLREEGARDAVEEKDGDEDEGFTMDMMLKSLNIELDVIGYDRELQKWID